jgi:hypothetical protein
VMPQKEAKQSPHATKGDKIDRAAVLHAMEMCPDDAALQAQSCELLGEELETRSPSFSTVRWSDFDVARAIRLAVVATKNHPEHGSVLLFACLCFPTCARGAHRI